MRPRISTILFILSSFLGLFFTAYSTSDFIEHLDRQVHAIHCSFVPGLIAADASASSGCHTALMSPYSSILRAWVWGGLPMSLLGMATFAFLLFRGAELWANRKQDDSGANLFLVVASIVPVITSIVMGSIAIFALGATCKVCMGIYAASFATFASAVAGYVMARMEKPYDPNATAADPAAPPAEEAPVAELVEHQGLIGHLIGAGEGVAFIGVTTLVYLLIAPDFSAYTGACGSLAKPEDPHGIMVPMGGKHGGKATIEVFDPLCPACRALDGRLAASGLGEQLDRKAVMFPLDTTCNWMVGSTMHPGACSIAEAVLCAGDKADDVIAWSFENQDAIKEAAGKAPAAAAEMVTAKFPTLKPCVGSKEVKVKLGQSLRWAVANKLPVLTPQIYVDGVKLCDEDTDLGLDYSLSRLIASAPPKPEAK